MSMYLSKKRYVEALKRIRKLIAGGLILTGCDDTTPGDKSTQCSWGLCQNDKDHWPDPIDYLWPDEPDRVAPKYLRDKMACPMDKRTYEEISGNGCFYSCRFFQSEKNPSMDEAVVLYDALIKRHSK